MRRARRKLQPNTFPFMAVLLCAMGSLILLLLILDRRAKVVALAKVEQSLRGAEDHKAQELAKARQDQAERDAEWQRQQEKVHAYLLQQDKQVMEELNQV